MTANTKWRDNKRAEVSERRAKALELRRRGASYRQIGKALGISHYQSHKDVQAELGKLAKLTQDEAETLRELELQRLDALTLALDSQVKDGYPPAVNSYLRVMERRAKLLGLDAPASIRVSVGLLVQLQQAFDSYGLDASEIFNAMLAELQGNDHEPK